MEDFSKETRKYIMSLLDYAENILQTDNEEQIYEIVYNHFNIIFRDLPLRVFCSNMACSSYEIKQVIALATASICQMYTDYYKIVNFNDYMDGTSNIDKIKVKDYNDIRKKFINKDFALNMIYSSVCYLQESAYEKVLQNMVLTEEDHELLSSINPFYEQEKEKFDIDMNTNFIIKNIKTWQKEFADEKELSFFAASSFLIDLYKIDQEKSKEIIIDILNSFDKELYIDNYDLNKETLIDVDGILLDDSILAKLIMDFYENNETKVLKLNNNEIKD